jgi:hypothetical protein
MAGKGGARPGAGRKKGVPNKATADVKEAARIHGPKAIEVLASLMVNADSDSAKISAANSILDRAYGKATQLVGGDPDADAIRMALQVGFVGASQGK